MPVAFPHPPVAASGDWAVRLPGNAAVGEVLVYGTPVTPPAGDFLRWPCSEFALPILETHGLDHTLAATSTGDVHFGRTSMRADGTGHAVSQDRPADLLALWSPPVATIGADFTFAALIGLDTFFGETTINIGISGVLQLRFGFTSSSSDPAQLYLWSGGTLHLVTTGFGEGPFVAVRIEAGGAFTIWSGADPPVTGTYSSYSPDATWRVRVSMNDADTYKFQELHVFPRFASDTEIEALRFALVGI